MVEPIPTKIPEWNTGGANRTEPTAGEKVSGWSINDEPPSSYFNWLQYYTGAWFAWLSERLDKGTLEHDVILRALSPAASGRGGHLELRAGDATTSGVGGDVTVEAGAGLNGNEGGDASLKAGGAADVNGGDVTIEGGTVTGTDRNSGEAKITTGDSSGTGYGLFDINVAEAETGGAGSGSYANPAALYVRMLGSGAAKNIQCKRFTTFDNAADTARGNIRIFEKAQPTTPSKGDVYLDSGSDQARLYDGSTYHGITPKAYALDFASFTVDDLTSTEKVFQLAGPADLKYTIPANYVDTGAIILVRSLFGRTGATPADEPGFNIRLGNYSTITGALLTTIQPKSGSAILDNFAVDLEVHIRAGGASGAVRAATRAQAHPSSSTWATPECSNAVRDLTTIPFNGSLDLYPTVVWNSVGSGNQNATCLHFTVYII